MLDARRAAADRNDARDAGIEQALAQNALSDHPGGAEEKDIHGASS